MMNKLIKLLLIQGLVLTGFSALAESSIGSAPVIDPKINGSAAQTILGPDGKPQLFTASGCPTGYLWQYSKTRPGTFDPMTNTTLNQDTTNLSVDDFYTVPLGSVKRNTAGAILGGFDEYTYQVFCKDTLNPTVRSGPSATITIKMDENSHPRNVSVVNKVEACGDELNNNAGARVLIDAQGCMGDTYWIHPNPAFNWQTDGSLKYWTQYNGPRAVINNEVQTGTFIAKCKLQYYDSVNYQTVYDFTEGFGTDVKRLNAAPKPTTETYTKFKNGNLKGTSVRLCAEETVELTHTIFEGSTDYTKDYSIQWLIEDNNGSRRGQDQFANQKVIKTNTEGTWYIKLFNNYGERACDQEYDNFNSRREIKNIIIEKPIIAGNSQVCPDGANAITVQNVGSLTGLTTYKWIVNGSVVPGQTEASYNATDNAKSVQVSYLSNIQSSLGTFCSAPLSDALTITPYTRPQKPIITKISGSDSYCDYNFPALDLTLESSNTSLSGTPTYSWKLGDNVIGGNSNQLLGSVNSLEGEYTVMITDGNGCQSLPSDKFLVTKFTRPLQPVVTKKSGDKSYCDYKFPLTDLILESSNTSLEGTATYKWSNQETTASISPSQDGFYSVNVTDGNGCTSIESAKYEIVKWTRPAQPIVTRKSGADAYCDYNFPVSDLSLESSNTSLVGNAIFNWNTQETTASIAPSKEGFYSVTVTDENGCTSIESAKYEIVKWTRPAQPIVTRTSGADAYCDDKFPVSDLSLVSSNTSLVGNAIFNWNTQEATASISPSKEGFYSVNVTDENGCKSIESAKYEIVKWTRPAKPIVTRKSGADAYCEYNFPVSDLSLESSNTSLNGKANFKWNTLETTASISPSKEGFYSVTVTDENGCTSDESAKYEIVKWTRPAQPVVTRKSGADAYCDYKFPVSDLSLVSSNTSLVGNPTYTWNTKESTSSIAPINEGFYSVNVTDGNGCYSIESAKYEIVKWTRPVKPVITRKTGADAYCDYKFPVSDLSLESTNTSLVGNAIYTWNKEIKTKVISVTTEGNYSVIVTDENGCESVTSDAYTITKWASPVAPSIAITGNKVNCALDDSDKAITVAFSVSNSSDKFSYEWFNTGSNSILSKTSALNSISTNGTYYSIQTDKNGCYSPKSEGIKVSFVQNPNFSGSRISKSTAYGLKADGFTDNWTQNGNSGTGGDYQWRTGTTLNPNIIDNIKVATANNGNGDYSVRRKYAFTVDNTPIVCFSNTVKYTFVGDPDFTGVAIYPNPTSGKVNIDLLDEWKNASVTVYDMVGRPVYTGTLNSDNATGKPIEFDLSSLGSGIYILNIQSSNGSKSYQGKILVNK
jgi:predicted RNase H-like HicB family nuclease